MYILFIQYLAKLLGAPEILLHDHLIIIAIQLFGGYYKPLYV
jgi:hypothetical protein